MSKLNELPDGEYFIDRPIKDGIPAADTWESMSVNQLIDVQVMLQNRMWEMRNSPVIARTLQTKLNELQALMAKRMAEGR